MTAVILPRHEGMSATTRLGFLVSRRDEVQLWEWCVLLGAGVAAALASMFMDFNLRIPGHAILRVVIPIAAGLAIVPRQSAGSVMGLTALLSSLGLRQAGYAGDGMSLGALTSLTATGPLLDWTLRHSHGGWRLYMGFALAGLASNLLALVVRGGAKLIGMEHAGGRPLGSWLMQASYTYVLCGVGAGLISGMLWFYSRRRNQPQHQGTAP